MGTSTSTRTAAADRVREYYDSFGEQEWMRLTRSDDGALEFAVTMRLLSKHLSPTGRVLNVGGGPGRYTLWLAERGYTVTLADLSPGLLAIARERAAETSHDGRIEAVVEADAVDWIFRAKSATDSGESRPPILSEAGHPVRQVRGK